MLARPLAQSMECSDFKAAEDVNRLINAVLLRAGSNDDVCRYHGIAMAQIKRGGRKSNYRKASAKIAKFLYGVLSIGMVIAYVIAENYGALNMTQCVELRKPTSLLPELKGT